MLDFKNEYSDWRSEKLNAWAQAAELQPIPIQNPNSLSEIELERLSQSCEDKNFALYRLLAPHQADQDAMRKMCEQIGLTELDQNLCADKNSISTLKVMDIGRARGYIPYTAHALNWHTDGYYNTLDESIRSFLLHCIQKAPDGGENIFLNHELIYIHLHDLDPDLVAALMQDDALTIPENIENGTLVRPAQTGPVFYRDSVTQALQMRYTARTKSIQWKQEPKVLEAVRLIEHLLKNNTYTLHYTLEAGEGFICNNILHGRSAFTNGNIPEHERVMYRVRSYNRLFFRN